MGMVALLDIDWYEGRFWKYLVRFTAGGGGCRLDPTPARRHGSDSTRPRGAYAVPRAEPAAGRTQGRAAVGPAPRGQHSPPALSTALVAGVALLCPVEASCPFPADPNGGGRGGFPVCTAPTRPMSRGKGVLSTGIPPWGPTFFHHLVEREEAGRGPGGPRVMAGVTSALAQPGCRAQACASPFQAQ